VDDFKNSLSLGSTEIEQNYIVNPNENLSNLGVGFVWNKTTDGSEGKSMATHIVRGMPYATMQYSGGALPTIYSFNGPAVSDAPILADGTKKMECGTKGSGGKTFSVEKDLEMHFINSDFTWVVFFSRPVKVMCEVAEGDEKTRDFQLSVVSYEAGEQPLIVRLALVNQCTTGEGNIKAHCTKKLEKEEIAAYAQAIREGASVFPTSSQISFSYPDEGSHDRVANMTIDWRAQSYSSSSSATDLLMFALPHHQEQLSASAEAKVTKQCVDTFHGETCLVKGKSWTLGEDLGAPMSLHARRPPAAEFIPTLAKALTTDIHYKLPNNLLRAAADTYFSGKILARVARVIAVAAEMNALASGETKALDYDDVDKDTLAKSAEAASSEVLPTKEEISEAVQQLKKGVQAWLKEEAEAPYVFDKSWGGFINCGCRYTRSDDKGYCNNTFPDCPALADVNEDFGNGK
jgi:endoglucanase Acf2